MWLISLWFYIMYEDIYDSKRMHVTKGKEEDKKSYCFEIISYKYTFNYVPQGKI